MCNRLKKRHRKTEDPKREVRNLSDQRDPRRGTEPVGVSSIRKIVSKPTRCVLTTTRVPVRYFLSFTEKLKVNGMSPEFGNKKLMAGLKDRQETFSWTTSPQRRIYSLRLEGRGVRIRYWVGMGGGCESGRGPPWSSRSLWGGPGDGWVLFSVVICIVVCPSRGSNTLYVESWCVWDMKTRVSSTE